MTAGQSVSDSGSAHLLSEDPDVLAHINEPGVNLCLWQRTGQQVIERELAELCAAKLPDQRMPTSKASFDDDISGFMLQHGLEPSEFANFRADLRRLARVFFDVCRHHQVMFRLFTTNQDDCRRFHVDHRHYRLLCTYRGPGTEWLADAQVDRVALESGKPNEAIIRFGEPAHFKTFWVGILKDDGFPGNEGSGLVHRSPPVEAAGQIRVMFCMDAMPERPPVAPVGT